MMNAKAVAERLIEIDEEVVIINVETKLIELLKNIIKLNK